MASPQRKLATYADLLALPADSRAEVLGGDVILSPAPLHRHSKAQGSARHFLGGPFDDDDGRGGPGGWWIFVEVDVQLTPHDIKRPTDVVPDCVCELLSPSTAARDRDTASARIAPFDAIELEIGRLFLLKEADEL